MLNGAKRYTIEMPFFRSECLFLLKISWIYYVYVGLTLIEYNVNAYVEGDGAAFQNLCIQKCAEQVRFSIFIFILYFDAFSVSPDVFVDHCY